MADENPNPNPNPDAGAKDAAYWEAEAKKAFADRDKAKQRAKELEGKALSDEQAARFQELEANAAKAEEERKRKAGEFDSLKQQLIDKHAKDLQERETKHAQLSERFKGTVVRAEFGAATDLFGGHDAAKTILDVDLGMAALGRYVEVEDADDDPRGYRIVVKDTKGNRILGKDGNPAPFAEAISELISLLPNRDRILRGSGKAGSGNAGGSSHNSGPVDLDALIRKANQGDPDALKELRARRPAGGMVQGSAWEKQRAAR